jgi:two-component system sensor histidine kinase YesM
MIRQLTGFNGRSLVVISPEGELLFSSIHGFNLADSGLSFEKYPVGEPVTVRINGENQLMTMLKSDKFNWTYVSFIPSSMLYSIPKRILALTLAILFITVAIGFILSFFLTRKNYRQIMNIINVFQAAEEGKPLPPMSEHIGDEYSYILQNVLKTFIEHDYLKIQLSLKQLSLKNAELLALQSQLNPHFIFNTLETINLEILSLTKRPTNANRMIEQLGHMLRYVLDRPGETVTLKEEIDNTKRYIEIQTYRYEDKFFVRWNVDDAALDFPIIPLLLQPLIENSIYHGIKEKEGRCGIKLSMHIEPSGLHIRITDNGLGIVPEDLSAIRQKLIHPEIDPGRHIGLYNANKRLALTFGEKYSISIRSRYTVGTYIHIFLPDFGM